MASATDQSANVWADLTIRSNSGFNAWVGRMAGQQRVSVATLIEHALSYYATSIDFEEEPPSRLKRDRVRNGE